MGSISAVEILFQDVKATVNKNDLIYFPFLKNEMQKLAMFLISEVYIVFMNL